MSDTVYQGLVLCPRCGVQHYTPYEVKSPSRDQLVAHPFPALSRVDNKTLICSPCGVDEAMRDFTGKGPIPLDEWPIG